MNTRNLVIKIMLWLTVAVLFGIAVCYPIFSQADYLLLPQNVALIALAFLYTRYILIFNQLKIKELKWLKYIVMVINILLFLAIIQQMEFVLGAYDAYAFDEIFTNHDLSITQQKKLADYQITQYLIASIAALVATFVFNIKLLKSFWRKNKVKKETIIHKES